MKLTLCAPVLLVLLPALLAAQPAAVPIPEGAQMHRDLVYARAPERELKLDLYLPPSGGATPLVVWIHGGAWRGGSKDRCPALPLVARGYAVASISYRLSGEAKFPAQIHDVKSAVRWLRANAARFRLDPDRVAAWGPSAGGHLAALLGTSGGAADLEGDLGNPDHSSRIQAVVNYFGPTDFLRMNDFPSKIDHDAPDSPESQLIGGEIQEDKEKAARANSITYVTPGDPPFLIVHGGQDPLVPPNQSELLERALRQAGVPVTLRVLEGAGHGGPPFFSEETLALVAAFLDQHLRPPETAPQPVSWVDPNRMQPAGTRYRIFHSLVAGGGVSYLVYLPPDYEAAPEKRFPVIYWLHGLGGNQRTGATFVRLLDEAVNDGKAPSTIAVLVNGMRDSMYCDAKDGSKSVQTVIVRELIPHVDKTYRTIAERRARAVEGYSMGGFGAAHLGFKHPDLFGAVSIMAGALHTADTIAERRPAIFHTIFGADKAYYQANSPWTLAETNADRIRGNTFVRIGVGGRDQLLDWNRGFHERLTRLGIASEFFVIDGVGHNGREYYKLLGDRLAGFYRTAFAGVE